MDQSVVGEESPLRSKPLAAALPTALRANRQVESRTGTVALVSRWKIVYDKFHIAKHLGEAVDKVSRKENRTLQAAGDDRLTGTRYDWLRNPAAMEPGERTDRYSDEVLFERSTELAEQKHFTAAHLSLETLINTYPDSEYADKARLASQDPQIASCEDAWTTSTDCDYNEPSWP